MQTNPIPGVMNTLKDAGFDEDQRMAMVTAITEMQYPLLEATERLRSEIRSEMKELRSGMADLGTEVKSEVKELRSGMADFGTEINSEIKDLRSEMDARLRPMSVVVYGLIIPILFIVYQVAPKAG